MKRGKKNLKFLPFWNSLNRAVRGKLCLIAKFGYLSSKSSDINIFSYKLFTEMM